MRPQGCALLEAAKGRPYTVAVSCCRWGPRRVSPVRGEAPFTSRGHAAHPLAAMSEGCCRHPPASPATAGHPAFPLSKPSHVACAAHLCPCAFEPTLHCCAACQSPAFPFRTHTPRCLPVKIGRAAHLCTTACTKAWCSHHPIAPMNGMRLPAPPPSPQVACASHPCIAAFGGAVALLRRLPRAGVDPDAGGHNGRRAPHIAAESNIPAVRAAPWLATC